MSVSNTQAHANVTVTQSVQSAGAVGGTVGYAMNNVSAPTFGGHFKVNADAAVKAGALVGELAGKLTNGANCARSNVVNNTVANKSGLGKGDIVSSHRINRITVRIRNAEGALVFNSVVYPFGGCAECKSYSLQTGFGTELSKLSLKSGNQYTYEVLVLVAGQEICVHDFSLTT